MNEKVIERKLRDKVKAKGGIALKFYSAFVTKFPDRLVLMPGGKIYWVEAKTTGETPDPGQKSRIRKLRKLGFDVSVIDDQHTLNEFLNRI